MKKTQRKLLREGKKALLCVAILVLAVAIFASCTIGFDSGKTGGKTQETTGGGTQQTPGGDPADPPIDKGNQPPIIKVPPTEVTPVPPAPPMEYGYTNVFHTAHFLDSFYYLPETVRFTDKESLRAHKAFQPIWVTDGSGQFVQEYNAPLEALAQKYDDAFFMHNQVVVTFFYANVWQSQRVNQVLLDKNGTLSVGVTHFMQGAQEGALYDMLSGEKKMMLVLELNQMLTPTSVISSIYQDPIKRIEVNYYMPEPWPYNELAFTATFGAPTNTSDLTPHIAYREFVPDIWPYPPTKVYINFCAGSGSYRFWVKSVKLINNELHIDIGHILPGVQEGEIVAVTDDIRYWGLTLELEYLSGVTGSTKVYY
ncbi:MAG: hypothetical protein FWD58_05625 [Firmicutes bacterium]|nr:hypothetical protein [Bacillota bacterium]